MNRPSAQTPGTASALQAWLGYALLFVAHFAVRPLFGGRPNVDFMVVAILFSALRMRPGLAAVMGLLSGLAMDALSPGSFGAAALSMTVIAYAASWIKAAFLGDHIALTALFVFAGKWLFDLSLSALAGGSAGESYVQRLLIWSPISAALTAVFAVLLLTMFRPLYRAPSTGAL